MFTIKLFAIIKLTFLFLYRFFAHTLSYLYVNKIRGLVELIQFMQQTFLVDKVIKHYTNCVNRQCIDIPPPLFFSSMY